MFAVIKTGGKQFRVAAGDVITIPKLAFDAGATITFDEVLMLTREGGIEVGAPGVSGASVTGEVVKQARGPKVIAFKKRRRKNSRRKRGHRQDLTIVRIGAIALNGETIAQYDASARPATATGSATANIAANLSLISGIGPKLEKRLRAAGVTSLEEIAGWDADEVRKRDEEFDLDGRIARDEWVEQAKELLAGKAPRAKSDQAELASGVDR
jgi:large subunit ribosomal protein L21